MGKKLLLPLLVIILLGMPLIVRLPYFLHILILSAMYVAYALSYDISAGHLGSVSLAHPAFFGTGAYVTGILAPMFGTPFWANFLLAAALVMILAFIMAQPAFRLADISFAIVTLGLAVSLQLVAQNWVELTRGPMCINNIPAVSLFSKGSSVLLSSLQGYYYLFLLVNIVVIVIYRLVTTGRIGRTFTAIRNDEILSATQGINVLRYKQLAFLIGAALAGGVGSIWAHYMTVVCPDYLGLSYTLNLLIIVFIGGVTNYRGIIVTAVVLTIVPEVLRVAPSIRLILYGILLFLAIVLMPEGLAGLVDSVRRRLRKSTSELQSAAAENQSASDSNDATPFSE
ncbi:MAG: branched-chain amino acid ABC transporter permease [Anaerolineales bacterium]|nr:branched-chain amino acid ABC transporter permease [Anaerolineales bacterium]